MLSGAGAAAGFWPNVNPGLLTGAVVASAGFSFADGFPKKKFDAGAVVAGAASLEAAAFGALLSPKVKLGASDGFSDVSVLVEPNPNIDGGLLVVVDDVALSADDVRVDEAAVPNPPNLGPVVD